MLLSICDTSIYTKPPFFLQPQTFTVEPWFVKWGDKQTKAQGGYCDHRKNVDAMLLEQTLIRNKHVEASTDIRYDFKWNDMFFEVKEISSRGTVSIDKHKVWVDRFGKTHSWWGSAVHEGILTHFLFHETTRDKNGVLRAGDKNTVTSTYVLPAEIVIKQLMNPGKIISLAAIKQTYEELNANTCNESAA